MHSLLPVLLALATASASPQASAGRREGEGRRDLPRRRPQRLAGLRARRLPRRPDRVRARLRDGQPGAERRQHAADGLRHRLDLQAVHGDRDPPARPRGQALARRRHPQVGSGDPVLRKDGDPPPPAPPHRRPARLHRADEPPGHGRRRTSRPSRTCSRSWPGRRRPNFAPGEDYLYCNTGYNLLALVVEKASGQSLRDFSEQRIFGAARHAPHADQRLPHADHPQPRHRLPEGGRAATGSRCPTGSRRATAPC